MADPSSAVTTLKDLARLSDGAIDVAMGMALIAKDVYPTLEPAALLAALDEMASPLFPLRLEERPGLEQARVLGDHVYGTLGFRGNEADYYDPKNSLLPDVLERRLGIPISLAVVYCEIARRVGVPARGVAFPGHFLVRLDARVRGAEQPIFIDPFFKGRLLDEEAICRLLKRALGPNAESSVAPYLAPATSRVVLVRILTNLKAIYLTRGDHARALLAADRILLFMPDAAGALKERGSLAARLGAHESAKADLSRALELAPDAADASAIKAQLAELSRKTRTLN